MERALLFGKGCVGLKKKINEEERHLVFQSLRAPKTNYAVAAMEIDY